MFQLRVNIRKRLQIVPRFRADPSAKSSYLGVGEWPHYYFSVYSGTSNTWDRAGDEEVANVVTGGCFMRKVWQKRTSRERRMIDGMHVGVMTRSRVLSPWVL